MTAQVHDRVSWRHRDYLLVGVDGDDLFHPFDHGLATVATTTANWRGWVAKYAIRDDKLVLAELHDVGLSAPQSESPPPLLGVPAERHGQWSFSYPGLNHPIAFTGRLLMAHGFIQSLYRHMGFHPAWKFEESWELDLERGRVTAARELSDEMRLLREKIQAGDEADPDDDTQPGWIERTFRLDFRRSKGR
jgi:hypothetical protein